MFLNSRTKLFKSIYYYNINPFRCLSNDKNAHSLLVNVLGMKDEIAKSFIAKYNINNLEINKLKDTVDFIKKQKYKLQDILKYPKILKQCGNKTWEHYLNYFIECGCTAVPISHIVHFRKIRFSSIAELKEIGVIPVNAVVVDNLVKQLDVPLPEEDINDLRNDNLTLSYVHRTVTHRYLKHKLAATDEDLEKISRLHSYIYNKSLRTLCKNVNIALEIDFTPEKILRNAYILQANPDITREMLNKRPFFLNCCMRSKMRVYPKLIGLSIERMDQTYAILKRHDISDDTISKAMNVFTLLPQTVDDRLKDIKSTPETRLLMNNPQTLQLIIHYHRAKNRLQFLHKVRLKCTSLVVIGFGGEIFDNYIKEGKDLNKRKEANNFLCALLQCTNHDVDVNLKKHPFYLYIPFVDIEATYRFLKANSFTNEHIIKAISILLYPSEKIEEVLDIIRDDHYLSTRKPRVNKSQILNLALYYLEKDHHFTGNGVWRINEDYVQTLQ